MSRVTLMFDEPLGGVTSTPAGTTIIETAANIEALSALVDLGRAYRMTDTPATTGDNVQFAAIDIRARRPFRGIALSTGIVGAGSLAGAPLARVLTNLPDAVTLTDYAGGKVALSGRLLVATSTSIAAGETLTVGVTVGAVSRTFTIAGSGAGGALPSPFRGVWNDNRAWNDAAVWKDAV